MPQDCLKAKTLILVNLRAVEDSAILFLKKIISKNKGFNFEVLGFYSELPPWLGDLNIPARLSEQYLTKQDRDGIDEFVFKNLSRTWYKGRTVFNGIDYGNLVEYDFQLYLLPRIKNLVIVKKAIDSIMPNKLIVIDDTGELLEVADFWGKNNNMPVLKYNLCQFDFVKDIKGMAFELMRIFVDRIVRIILTFKKYPGKIVALDCRLYGQLSRISGIKCVQIPFEKGLGIRQNFLKKGLYIPFCFPSVYEIRPLKGIFVDKWKELKDSLDFKAGFSYRGVCFWDLVEDKVEKIFLKSFPRIQRNIKRLKKFAGRGNIGLFVTRNDVRELEKAIVMAAKGLDLPTLVIQHGIMVEDNGQDIVYADRMAVWGEAYIRKYVKLGNDSSKFIVTGNPRYDGLYNRKDTLSKERLCGWLKINPDNKIIVFATQPVSKFSAHRSDDDCEVLLRGILSAVKQLPGVSIIIKLHPFESGNMQKKIMTEFNLSNAEITKEVNIWNLINVSDLLITLNSTAALEAMINGKPAITINLSKRKESIPYDDSGAAVGVYNTADILPSIKQILEDPLLRRSLHKSAQGFIADYAYCIDGKATRRVEELITRMISR